MTVTDNQTCAKCERAIVACQECDGTGNLDGETCDLCLGERSGCPVHHTDWRDQRTH